VYVECQEGGTTLNDAQVSATVGGNTYYPDAQGRIFLETCEPLYAVGDSESIG